MKRRKLLLALGIVLWTPAAVAGQSLAKAKRPEDEGFSSERLAKITPYLQVQVDKKSFPGATVLVARNGKIIYQQAVGFQDREKGTPMKTDTIFRIASMTKPITSVAVMMLAEDGRIDLLAPVTDYLPEFKNVKVGVEKKNPGTGAVSLALEDPQRPMTVQDLLRHTSGIVYGPFGNTLVHQAYNQANLFDGGQTLAEFIGKLSKLPLAHQPGTVWEYGMNTDVLGRIVEVVSGTPFDQFVAERITKPLGMKDTAFYLTPEQASRLAELQVDPATGKRPTTTPGENLTKDKVKWFSGGGGLLSTADDYARFCQMLLNGGEWNGVRLLSPKTIAMMTSDQLLPGMALAGFEDMAPIPALGQSFGLGFAVRTRLGPNPLDGSVGDFFWAGIFGTYFWIDPQTKMFTVFMIQQLPFEVDGPYRRAVRELVYGAMVN